MKQALRWVAGLALCLVALAAAAVACLLWLTLPGGDLTAAIPSLRQPVEITIDGYGIPRIHAGSEHDAAAALGFLHARERLFEMDMMRRAARGELSEIVGPLTLPLDRFNRTLNLRDHAAADLAALTPDTRALLEAYASGVNAWIARRGRFSALEFAVLGTPRPWTPADCLLWGKTMGMYLSGNWRIKLARLALSARLTPAQIEALWPAQDAASPQARLNPAMFPGLVPTARRLAALLPRFPDRFTLPATASNAWAVDGAHSVTGAPLLAGDPHLSFGLPPIWYLARIETPNATLVGATAPGVPFLILGHNRAIAWSFTSTGADVQDLFVETPAGDGYLTEAGPRAFTARTEIIHVRGAPDDVLRVRETRHGPVISDLARSSTNIISVEMANLAPGDTAADGLLALNRAGNVAKAGQAAAEITAPVQNLVVADRHDIALFVTGRVPVRRAGDAAFAVRGDDGRHDWVGWATGADLPHVIAPASGRLVNANERVAPPDFPVFLGHDWNGDTRARRIRQLLDAHPKAGVDDFTAMQFDDLDLTAQALLPRLAAIEPRLAHWNARADRTRPEPLIFNAWMIEFNRMLLASHDASNSAAAASWPDLVTAALRPGNALCGVQCDAMLRESHDRAMDALARRFGPNPADWRWGAAHQAVFDTIALRAVPLLGRAAAARIAQSGDDSTLQRGGVRQDTLESVHGAAYRGVYDLADLERSRFMVSPGQSGDPISPLARNMMSKWRNGDTISISAEAKSVSVSIRLIP